ncbi:MAG: GntR family transcriptional regulator [Burkholderiales bacterium]|nr:GntR family transcriptional regulator [Burkholderiales bacterium]
MSRGRTSPPPPEAPGPGIAYASPLFRQIERQMLAALSRGEWKPGSAIPAERHLAERFGSSIGTVRRAIDELVAGNILIRQQGRGTFVASHTRERLLYHFFHIVGESGAKSYPEVEFLSFAKARADRIAAEKLHVAVGDPVFRVRNRLQLLGAPIMIDDITIPAVRFAGMTEARFRGRASTIYNLYQQVFGVYVVRTSERLRAILADADSAALLGIASGAPLLQIRRVALSYNEVPVEYRISLVDTAHNEYWAEIGRGA